MAYRSGIHTVEIRTDSYINRLEILQQVKGKRYKLNVEARDTWPRYQTIAQTEAVIHEVFDEIGIQAAPAITRADYRLDNRDDPYEEELPVMRAVVRLIAYQTGQTGRIQCTKHGEAEITHSVRCMPDEDDRTALFGIEYYDKQYQRGSEEYGKARLELRSLNMNGESIAQALDRWKKLILSIDRTVYRDMLHAHAVALAGTRAPNERAESFVRRVLPVLIGREEEHMLRRLIGSETNRRQGAFLPGWREVRAKLFKIVSQIEADGKGELPPIRGR